jgi:hypothetical protein
MNLYTGANSSSTMIEHLYKQHTSVEVYEYCASLFSDFVRAASAMPTDAANIAKSYYATMHAFLERHSHRVELYDALRIMAMCYVYDPMASQLVELFTKPREGESKMKGVAVNVITQFWDLYPQIAPIGRVMTMFDCS